MSTTPASVPAPDTTPSRTDMSDESGLAGRLVARFAFPLVYLALAAVLAGLFFRILKINNGTFLYTLDDPYIHLALSSQIRHGNYGLYPGTHAAPSSSILYPFLLAPGAGTRVHPYLPLALNVCALFLTVELMRRFLRHLRLGTGAFAFAAQAGAVFLAAVCFNLAGVVFTGLEHSLHIAAVAATVYGLALFLDRDELPIWLPAVLVLSPLIRYEGVALSVGALVVLAMRGRVRLALATFAVIALSLGGFSAYLMHLGLPPLPSSILSKSAVVAGSVAGGGGNFRSGFLQNITTALAHPIGLMLALVGVAAALRCAREISRHGLFRPGDRWTDNGSMCLALLFLLAGQMIAGRWGWFERYEIYAIVATAMIAVYLGRRVIRETLLPLPPPAGRDRYLYAGALACGLCVFGSRYLATTLNVPFGSNNIYEQQFQMHTFVDRFYRGPVAVNDLGLVSYRNPFFVLDLGGLGSEKARLLAVHNGTAADYQSLVAANGVHLVMVYGELFQGRLPLSWQKVAAISLSRPGYTAALPDVGFYVTDAATAATVRPELAAFQKALPPRVKLTLY